MFNIVHDRVLFFLAKAENKEAYIKKKNKFKKIKLCSFLPSHKFAHEMCHYMYQTAISL